MICRAEGCSNLTDDEKAWKFRSDVSSVISYYFFWTRDRNNGNGELSENGLFNFLGENYESANNRAQNHNITLLAHRENIYALSLIRGALIDLIQEKDNWMTMHIYDITPTSWANLWLWTGHPSEFGVTPIWTFGTGKTEWFMLDLESGNIMAQHRVKRQ